MKEFKLLFWILATSCVVLQAYCKELYLITTPNVLLSDAVHKFNCFVSTNVSLVIETTHLASNISNRTNVIFLKRGYQSITYFVPFIGSHLGTSLKLRFLGDACLNKPLTEIKGQFINETREIDILIDNFIIFSETDKPIYKPGDLVKLRAMAIYATNLMLSPEIRGPYVEILFKNGTYDKVPALKKVKNNFDSITIETPDNVKMAQWLNVSFEEAMNMSFNLSQDPMFGQWKITLIFGSKKEVTFFTVKKYVLPRFVVELLPPVVLLVSDRSTTVQVCATYSTGKNIQALIRGHMCIHLQRQICRAFVASLNGIMKCTNITINDSSFELINRTNIYFRKPTTFNVTVTENGTTHEISKSITLPDMKRSSYTIKLKSKSYYKPGLPYFGKLSLLRHDGRGQQNTRVLISASSSYQESWGFEKNYTSNEVGIVEFIIPYIPVHSRISLEVIGQKGDNENVLEKPSLYYSLANWESKNNEFIQVSPVTKSLKCPGTVKLEILMNGDVSSNSVYVQIMSRGIINKFIEYSPVPFKCTNRNDHLGHYRCIDNNRVQCLAGWTGGSCRQPVCTMGCVKGACIEPNMCFCKSGWIGKSCDTCVRMQGCVHGFCKYGNDCQCMPGWIGYQCDRKGPKIHHYNEVTIPPMTTVSPKPQSDYQNLTIFERYIYLELDKDFGPDLHFVVYYINADNEVIADNIEISKGLTNCSHVGKGKFKFDKQTATPGDVVKLSLNPGTLKRSCAVRISDVVLSQFGQSSNINLGYLVNKLLELNHKITKENRRRFGKEVCLKERDKRSIMYYPGLGSGFDSRKSFVQSGLTPITNARIVNAKCRTFLGRQRINVQYDGMPSMSAYNKETKVESAEIKKQIRDFFPETWVFDYYNVTPTQFNLTVPDSMTTWKANSFCMTEKGIWIAPSRYLKVILPFFADIYVPYSIKMGENLQLPVKLFNYVDACYEINVEISVNASEIKITGPKSLTICVCTNDVKTIHFNIKAKVIGTLNVTVKANSKYSKFCSNGEKEDKVVNLSDAVRRQLLVEPPGVPSETTFSEIICPNKEQLGLKSEFRIPSKIVAGSLRTYVVYNGDVMGQTFDNLDRLVRMPYGCGEQNMVALVPSIYVLNYVTNLKISDVALVTKAKQYIVDGYQRQLTYKHPDGSYSAFGARDKSGSTWLTAFVVKSFTDASKYVPEVKSTLKVSIQYLEKMQKPNGCFKEQGQLLSNAMAGGLKNKGKTDESLLTAYVLISLGNTKISKTSFNISKAITCVRSGLAQNASAYRLALIGYALSIHDPENVAPVLSQLKNSSTTEGRYTYWKSGLDTSKIYGQINSADIETTGYALLALNNYEALPYLSSIIYWLSSRQTSLGGYYSTQDTIVALNAISVFAEKIGTTTFDKVTLDINLDNELVRSETVTNSNRLITRKINVGSRDVSYVSVMANGTGCVSLQVKSLYNIEKLYSATEEFKIKVKPLLVDIQKCTRMEVTVCSSYLRKDRDSNMILITIDFPSGWELSNEEKTELNKQIMTPLKRIDFVRNKMHLYYDSFSYAVENNERCFTFRLDELTKVKDLKPSLIRMVDYYKPEIYSDTSYMVPVSMCKISEPTKPKPPPELLCPQCFDDKVIGVLDFQSRICPWSYAGLVMPTVKKSLKDRTFFQSQNGMFYEWTVDLMPASCPCVKTWPNISDAFAVISSTYLWLTDTLQFSNTSALYSKKVLYDAYKSDLRTSCQAAANLATMLNRLLPDFNASTKTNGSCATCILQSNLYYKVQNVTGFLCSDQKIWSLELNSVENATISGSLISESNDTISITATFPLDNCFCLQQLKDSKKSFDIVDLNNVLSSKNRGNETMNLIFDDKFEIIERNVFNNVKCR